MRRPTSVTPPPAEGSVVAKTASTTLAVASAQEREVTYSEVTHGDTLQVRPGGDDLVAVIPAHNEGDDIEACLQSLYEGTVWPDLTFVVANNCTDDTVEKVLAFQATHQEFPLALHHVEGLEGRKTGALCYAWEQLRTLSYAYFVSMDGDVLLDEHCIEDLLEEIAQDETLGGVAARYSFLPSIARGPASRLMLFYQRMDFASWTSNLLMERNRETYVLGGQVSIMRVEAMEAAATLGNRPYPWSSATAVEDMELTWKLNDSGFKTRCSAQARAWVGYMNTRRALWGQRTKWDRGIIDLLRDPASKGNKSHYLREPKRQQWRALVDLVLRVLLYTALPLALMRGSYQLFEQWWMPVLAFLPVALSIVIGVITAWITPRRRPLEVLAAALYVPLEGYVWLRTAIWARAWLGALRGEKEDLWASQARSEGRAAPLQQSSLRGGATSTPVHPSVLVGNQALAPAAGNDDAGRRRLELRPLTRSDSGRLTREERDRRREEEERKARGQRAAKAPTEHTRARGNKHRFRVTLLPVLAASTLLVLALTWLHRGWWLAVVILGLATLVTFASLCLAWLGDARDRRGGTQPSAFRSATWVVLLITAALLFLVTFNVAVFKIIWAWLKYLVYLAGPVVDVYLYFAWYSLLVITIVLCIVLVVKIFKILSLLRAGLTP